MRPFKCLSCVGVMTSKFGGTRQRAESGYQCQLSTRLGFFVAQRGVQGSIFSLGVLAEVRKKQEKCCEQLKKHEILPLQWRSYILNLRTFKGVIIVSWWQISIFVFQENNFRVDFPNTSLLLHGHSDHISIKTNGKGKTY